KEAGKTIVNRTEPELVPNNASSASQPLMAGTVIALPFGQPPAEPLPAVAGLRKAAMPDGEHRTLFSDHKHSVHPLRSPQRVECLTGSLCDWSCHVERSIDRRLDADMAAQRLEVGIGQRIGTLAYDLQPPCAVGVNDGGNALTSLGLGARR